MILWYHCPEEMMPPISQFEEVPLTGTIIYCVPFTIPKPADFAFCCSPGVLTSGHGRGSKDLPFAMY